MPKKVAQHYAIIASTKSVLGTAASIVADPQIPIPNNPVADEQTIAN